MKFLHIEEAKHLGDFCVWLRFNDGTEGIVDLENSLEGPIYKPLKDLKYFKDFRIEGHTLSWANGADFAPEYLRSVTTEKYTSSRSS